MSKIFLFVACFVGLSIAQIFYPEADTNANRKPQGHTREPVTSSKCGEGELLYPGDNNGDWVCDCRPAYVYYPLTNKCYRAYTQGPCNKNEILVLPKSKMIPICQRNECETGKVKYNGTCSVLESPDACTQPSKDRKTHRLYVDATTLQLQCTLLTNTRDPGVIDEESGLYESDHCFTGGRRSQNGNCRQSSA